MHRCANRAPRSHRPRCCGKCGCLCGISDISILAILPYALGNFLIRREWPSTVRLSSTWSRRDTPLYGTLQISVEVLARVQLRRIGRQKEHLDAIGICVQPIANRLCLMDVPIVQNQKGLTLGVLLQSAHEWNQTLNAASVDLESHFALIGHCGNQRQALATRRNFDDRCLTARRIASVPTLIAASAGLIAPANLSYFPLRSCHYLRIQCRQPLLHCLNVALIGSACRFLWCIAPV